jgi:hypothetical protein
MKIQPTKSKKTLANHISKRDKYPEYFRNSNSATKKHLTLKLAKESNRRISKEDT